MSDRPDSSVGRPAARPQRRPLAADVEPEVIVVPYRAGRHSAKLLPPIVLLVLGTAFLAYRARSSDWRGLSALFEPRPRTAAPPAVAPPPRPDEPTAPLAVAEQAEPPAVAQPADKEKTEAKAKDETPPAATASTADPLDDIRREAETARERIAELEKLKEREAQKLDETADERERADRLNRSLNPRFNLGRMPRDQIERMLKAQDALLRQRLADLEQYHRRQMEQMAAIERDFFGGRGRMFVPPPPLPEFRANPGGFRFREFRVPNGPQVFRFELRPGGPPPRPDDDAPPPPRPAPRRFD